MIFIALKLQYNLTRFSQINLLVHKSGNKVIPWKGYHNKITWKLQTCFDNE
jgi:hypothetical protein